MSKKYLSLEEAAELLSIPKDELMRMRERGDIRGFADRGNWKFKVDDVETLARSRQTDSSPDVPLFSPDDESSDSDISLTSDEASLDDLGSDSDVKLVGGDADAIGFDSDSDVKLVGMDSDSDVKLEMSGTAPEIDVPDDSDSDVKLVGSDEESDSDVKLMEDDALNLDSKSDDDLAVPSDSDSIAPESGIDFGMDTDMTDSDSDVQLLRDDDDVMLLGDDDNALSLDEPSSPAQDSVLAEESGISLTGDSSLMLGAESGISLEGPSDSGIAFDASDDEGITLSMDDDPDSGISLDLGDSGISLEGPDDSGISLDSGDSGISLEGDDYSGTIPMMDVMGDDDVPETQFEIPSIEDDSEYDLEFDDDDTGVMEIQSGESGEATLDDAVFDLDDDMDSFDSGEAMSDIDLEDDVFDDEDELDVFDADEDVFEDEEGQEFSSPVGHRMAVEADWGTGTFVGLVIASLFLLVCGSVMIDLVKNTATASTPNPISGMLLDTLGGLYK